MEIRYRGKSSAAADKEICRLVGEWSEQKADAVLPFVYTVSGGKLGLNASMTNAYRNGAGDVKLIYGEFDEKSLRLEFLACNAPLKITLAVSAEREGVYRRKLWVENVGCETVDLTGLSHLVEAFSYGNSLSGKDYRLKYCTQIWYGEGQWHDVSLYDAGVFDESFAPPMNSFEIGGNSSQTTARFYPNLFLEEGGGKSCFFCELEVDGAWLMAVEPHRSWWKDDGVLTVFAGCAEDRRIGFVYPLRAGERYDAADCVYGFAANFHEAVKLQTDARRIARRRIPKQPLIVFNDYLNCLWADPAEEKCFALARAAKALGAEAYVMDAGWFEKYGVGWTENLGVWNTLSDRFPNGLDVFIRKITDMGLIAGVWFEIEVCCNRVAKTLPAEWFLRDGNGRLIGNSERSFFDFTNEGATAYLSEKIGVLLDMGVRFIKNDYNDSYFGAGASGASAVQKNLRAFYRFIDGLYEKYPDLVIENCGSGAMRSDGGALSHFSLQSFSDQDDYRLYSSIVKGSLVNIPPEQLGIWCMAHPVHVSGKELKRESSDEEVIVYNFVTALAGVPYLSGRIDLCTSEEAALFATGVRVAKEIRGFVKQAYAEYPLGFSAITDHDWDALVLSNASGEEKLFYVWRLDGLPQKSFAGWENYEEEQLFPPAPVQRERRGGELLITLPHRYTAVLFRLKKIR